MGAARRIVVATDLTARSEPALHRAASLARQSGARLGIVHAIDPRQTERAVRAQANRAYVQMLARADQLFGFAAGFIDVAVRAGGPRDVIAKAANEWDADLIVVAAPRSRRLDSIVGTTAERLIRNAKRPLLVVHRAGEGSYRHVAIAADLSSTSLPMMQSTVGLGVLAGADVTLIHAVYPPYEGMLKAVGVDEAAIHQYQHGWRDEAALNLRAMIAQAGIETERARVIVRTDAPAPAIREVIEHERPELLAIGASRWFLLKRLLIGSVADNLLRSGHCDVLVIPARDSNAQAERPPVQRALRQQLQPPAA